MKTLTKIKTKIQNFLNGRVTPEKFGFDFPDLVFDHEEELYAGDRKLFNVIDDLRWTCALYNPDMPEGNKDYVSLEKMRQVAVYTLEQLTHAAASKLAA
ncbi:MAG: hypothetical protein WCP79_12305 [Bacillota bacterium]